MEIRKPNLSSAAFILKKRLEAQGITISHLEALEHAAAMEGYQSYQAYQAHQEEMKDWEKPVLVSEYPDETGRDYRYVGEQNSGVWIRMRNINVKVHCADEGVIVDMYASGAEDDDALNSTYTFYSEAAEVQAERAENLDDMRGHMKLLLSYQKVKLVEDKTQPGVWHWKLGKKVDSSSYASEWEACVAAFETVFA